ncbi:hypothetical protein RHMOL_Rhmol04G0052400 [Rhododendron molle]|uniref:Uncharacterized protein n=1 Tax=Rhododendron molle TaxID=49168 RepID=A0ACC0NYD9_RHOML|nr:hypothetical protein RHMOL_Rhmol04G0052400 [Rhododendron molle]
MEKWVQIFKRPVVFEVLSQIDGPVGFQVTKGFHHVELPTVIAGFSLPIPPPSFVAIPQTLRKSWLYDASTWFATQWVHGAAWFEAPSHNGSSTYAIGPRCEVAGFHVSSRPTASSRDSNSPLHG